MAISYLTTKSVYFQYFSLIFVIYNVFSESLNAVQMKHQRGIYAYCVCLHKITMYYEAGCQLNFTKRKNGARI